MKIKPCFIIAHRYVRGYTSYIEHYVDNIHKFYENSLVIIVDNNSPYKDDVLNKFKNKENIVLLDNNIANKFESGAYLVGVNYILENNLLEKYDYYVFTQDTYILKNKYDFDILSQKNVLACPITWGVGTQDLPMYFLTPHLENLGLNNLNVEVNYNTAILDSSVYNNDELLKKILHCYCSVFIIEKSKINELQWYLNKIKITDRWGSELFERYFAWVLYKLNNNKNYQIDINPYSLYDCYNINLHEDFTHGFFAKQQQRKRENTPD